MEVLPVHVTKGWLQTTALFGFIYFLLITFPLETKKEKGHRTANLELHCIANTITELLQTCY